MNSLNTRKIQILENLLDKHNLNTIEKLHIAVKKDYKDEHISKNNIRCFVNEQKQLLKEQILQQKVTKTANKTRTIRHSRVLPFPGQFLDIDYSTMELHVIQRYCNEHGIPLEDIYDNKNAIVERINYIMPLHKFDKATTSLEGLKWYCRVRNLSFNEQDTFDTFILTIQRFNQDIKNGKCIDKYRVIV